MKAESAYACLSDGRVVPMKIGEDGRFSFTNDGKAATVESIVARTGVRWCFGNVPQPVEVKHGIEATCYKPKVDETPPRWPIFELGE